METFPAADDALDAMAATGCKLGEQIDEVTTELLSDDGYNFLMPYVAQIWFAFVPPGTRGPVTSGENLVAAVKDELQEITAHLEAPEDPATVTAFLRDGCQPELALAISALVLRTLAGLPKKQMPPASDQIIMLAVLKAVIEELDYAVRALHSRSV
jgi:hypothetical protein